MFAGGRHIHNTVSRIAALTGQNKKSKAPENVIFHVYANSRINSVVLPLMWKQRNSSASLEEEWQTDGNRPSLSKAQPLAIKTVGKCELVAE